MRVLACDKDFIFKVRVVCKGVSVVLIGGFMPLLNKILCRRMLIIEDNTQHSFLTVSYYQFYWNEVYTVRRM